MTKNCCKKNHLHGIILNSTFTLEVIMAHEKFDGLKFEMDCMPTQRPQISEQNLGLRRNTTFQQLFGALQIIPAATYNAMAQQPPANSLTKQPPARPKVDEEIDGLQFYMELDEPKAANTNQTSGAASPKSKENRRPSFPGNTETPSASASITNQQASATSKTDETPSASASIMNQQASATSKTYPAFKPLPAKTVTKAPHLALSTQQNIAQVSQLATSCTPSPGTAPRVLGFTPRTSPSPKAPTPTSHSGAQSPAFVVKSPCMFRDSYPECDLPVVVGRPSDKSSCGIQLMESIFSQRAAQPVEAASSSQNPESTQSSPVGSFEEFKFSI
jgi:hypothetical protein